MRNLVARELKERNRPDITRSYMGMSPEHVEHQIKPTLDDKEPILDNVAANRPKSYSILVNKKTVHSP